MTLFVIYLLLSGIGFPLSIAYIIINHKKKGVNKNATDNI